jgi:predicted HAD superfamily Cof-like phosphohydrolase
MITQQDIDDCAEDRLAGIIEMYKQVKDLPDDPSVEYWDHTPLEMVQEFSTAMGHPLGENWYFNIKLEDMRFGLIREEFGEVSDESDAGNHPAGMLKELADLIYVTYGYAATYGWDLDEAVRRVHVSNMSKLGVDGKPLKRPDGKVLKGPNYQKPDLSDLV